MHHPVIASPSPCITSPYITQSLHHPVLSSPGNESASPCITRYLHQPASGSLYHLVLASSGSCITVMNQLVLATACPWLLASPGPSIKIFLHYLVLAALGLCVTQSLHHPILASPCPFVTGPCITQHPILASPGSCISQPLGRSLRVPVFAPPGSCISQPMARGLLHHSVLASSSPGLAASCITWSLRYPVLASARPS